jgi:hypothetical protein
VTVNEGGQAIVGPVSHGGAGAQSKMANNPMHKAHAAPRCAAKSKRSVVHGLQPKDQIEVYKQCRAPAMKGRGSATFTGASPLARLVGNSLAGMFMVGSRTSFRAFLASSEARWLLLFSFCEIHEPVAASAFRSAAMTLRIWSASSPHPLGHTFLDQQSDGCSGGRVHYSKQNGVGSF